MVATPAFPAQGLVIGVSTWGRRGRVDELGRPARLLVLFLAARRRHARHLDRHAGVALVALVVATRRGRPEPSLLLERQSLARERGRREEEEEEEDERSGGADED